MQYRCIHLQIVWETCNKGGQYLPDFLDLRATFPDQGPTLAGRDHESQCHWGLAGGRAVAHGINDVLGRRKQACWIHISEHSSVAWEHGEDV